MQNFLLRIVTALALGLLFWLAFIFLPPIYFTGILLAILIQIIVFEWTRLFNMHGWAFWLLLPLYPVLPFIFLIIMNHEPLYRHLLFVLFILVSSHDTGSYIVGNLLGRHKILPQVSPNKTWEGFIGGYIFATIGLAWLLWEFEALISWWGIALFSLIICTLSLMGDLFESWLKRRAQIKDSGSILPGHGGFLDRFDGILFTAFFFYIFKSQLVKIFTL